jgi:CRP/FNR family cyclic AMP-dependent transcriptional regulator
MDPLRCAVATILVDRLSWPYETATEIAKDAHIGSYDRDGRIFHSGESSDLCYVLLSGAIKVYYDNATGERMLVTILQSGGLFGFGELDATDGREPRQIFTAQALTRCKVAIITRARVTRALRSLSAPEILPIVQRSNEQWVRLCNRFLDFLTMTVRSRLTYAIKEISETFGIEDARGRLISLKLTHEDFADLVGASRPMVSKHLKDLARSGVFSKVGGRYILAREGLAGASSSSPPPHLRMAGSNKRLAPSKSLAEVPRKLRYRGVARSSQRRRPAVPLARAVE